MKVDFFKDKCQKTISSKRFGICDEDNKKPAYTDMKDESKWIATIENNSPKQIQFTANDNCIDILRENGEMENRCDVMLTYDSTLLFVELKSKRANWKSEGLGQIESTIKRMLIDEEDYYYNFRKRKAIVANSKNTFPYFQDSDTDTREYFKKNYKMHVQFEAEIIIN